MLSDKTSLIADTLHGTIRLSEMEMTVISSPIFNRLHDVSQNSTAYLTFPTNRTKRFEHSIGTMFLAGELFRYSIMNAEEDVRGKFFSKLNEIINDRISQILKDKEMRFKQTIGDTNYREDVLGKYSDYIDGIRVIDEWIPYNVDKDYQFAYYGLMQSVRLAGLMHDVGHPPFSHITEGALKELWKEVSQGSDNLEGQEACFYEAIRSYFENDSELHEKIGNQITGRLLEGMHEPMPNDRRLQRELLPEHLYKVMVYEMTMVILDEKKPFFADIHRIISGAVDADRLDYVVRDVINSGLNAGRIEYDRLIPRMKLLYDADADRFFFCPSIKSIGVLEDFFIRRWNLYKKIIFHHRVIKTDYLLRDCVSVLLKKNLHMEGVKDVDEKFLPPDISGLWRAVEWNPSDMVHFNRLIQWDDGWLMNILKKEFLKQLDSGRLGGEDALYDKLTELVASEKHYFSVVKDANMFSEIDNAAIAEIRSHAKDIEDAKSALTGRPRGAGLLIDAFLLDIDKLVKFVEDYSDSPSFTLEKGFALGEIARMVFDIYLSRSKFNSIVQSAVSEMVNNEIIDTVVEFKMIKSGIQKGFYVYKSDDEMVLFEKASKTVAELKLQRKYVLPFYIYINPKNPETIDYSSIRRDIGVRIGALICDTIVDYLKMLDKIAE